VYLYHTGWARAIVYLYYTAQLRAITHSSPYHIYCQRLTDLEGGVPSGCHLNAWIVSQGTKEAGIPLAGEFHEAREDRLA